ncbi:hypothetical protein [Haloarcula rubripromontorii]|uniref:hypothetical protein n=1 Tax=Haloarcula rubripromontorii TaxID=1705562 RepID=UPI00345BA605
MPEATLRLRARRNGNGVVLEYHPEDRPVAESMLDDHRMALKTLYSAVDRSKVSDKQVVGEITVFPFSGQYSLEFESDARRDLALSQLERVNNQLSEFITGDAA